MTADVTQTVSEAIERLDSASGEMVLDLSTTERIDARALRALEELARKARARSVKILLRGVNIDVYKVLKLIEIESQFRFQ